ncbi:hypothetical protein D9M70_365870 [compost metagenome]
MAARGPVEQRLPPRQAHRHAQRRLVRRRDEDQRRLAGQRLHHQPFAVDRHRHHARAQSLEQCAGHRVARIFHGHHGARPQQQPGGQVDALLRAGGDQDIGGSALHATGEGDMGGNGLPQRHLATGIRWRGRALPLRRQCRAHAARPGFVREARGVGLARLEGIARTTGRPEEGRLDRHPAPHRRRQHRRGGDAHRLARQPLGDIGAVADARVQPALRHQPLIGGGYGLARDAQLRAEQPRGRHARACLQAPGLDGVADLVDDLRGQVAGVVQREMELHGRRLELVYQFCRKLAVYGANCGGYL